MICSVKDYSIESLYNFISKFSEISLSKSGLVDIVHSDLYHIDAYFVDDKIVALVIYWILLDTMELDYIMVDINFRKLGLASKLFNYIVRTNPSVRIIRLEVASTNDAAISFYKKHSFTEIRIREKYYHNCIDAIEMKKELIDE